MTGHELGTEGFYGVNDEKYDGIDAQGLHGARDGKYGEAEILDSKWSGLEKCAEAVIQDLLVVRDEKNDMTSCDKY